MTVSNMAYSKSLLKVYKYIFLIGRGHVASRDSHNFLRLLFVVNQEHEVSVIISS